MKRTSVVCIVVLLYCLGVCSSSWAQVPAFPGAEGAGALSQGGRGGQVIAVTNLDDSGPGSLREAVNTPGKRTIVFRQGGIITLKSPLEINHPYVTIAGQTAPGGGIIIKGNYLSLHNSVHDVIVRYLTVRLGSEAGFSGQGGDCVSIGDGAHALIFDHCSFGWSQDETIGIWSDTKPVYDITFSDNIIAEALNYDHPGSGFIVGSNTISKDIRGLSIIRNALFSNFNRNPLLKCRDGEIINNIVYNADKYSTMIAGGIEVDIVGNLYQAGPQSDTRSAVLHRPSDGTPNTGPTGSPSIFLSENQGQNGETSWEALLEQTAAQHWGYPGSPPRKKSLEVSSRREERLSKPNYTRHPVSVIPVSALEGELLPGVGASQQLNGQGTFVNNRNNVDERLISEYSARQGTNPNTEADVGGYPVLSAGTPYADSDGDGMSDEWEDEYGFNKNDASDGNQDADGDGYTNVEEFLNGSPTVAPPNEPTSPPPPTAELTEGTYELHPVSSLDKVVAVTGSGNGSNVALATDNDQSNQRWQLTKQANGYYRIVREGSSKQCLDVRKRGTDNGTNVQTWRYNPGGQSNQEWKLVLEEAAKGYYSLAPRHAEEAGLAMRLDVAENSTETGANFHLWTSHGRANQRFVLEKISGENARLAGSADKGTLTTTEDALAVYPNPTSGEEVRISGLLPTAGSLRIIDALGREVLQQSWKGPHTRMNIRSLKSGLYHIVITQQGKTTHHPLIKQ